MVRVVLALLMTLLNMARLQESCRVTPAPSVAAAPFGAGYIEGFEKTLAKYE